ncbi:hypothetical protein [Alicyclobacillus fastidiosus]|uniref:DUF4367 domain-containing protein n=1 Tax=Alicyclobacillus fastidiosus TaxID=392011 RepID=A0ABV5AI63_9BACL|nr:hypothetical protein [Alicyclobacillus fastidiosus]WEH10151.1 hypothetical protein PYS47_02390 [Alicyclobacillus fastidiosus]
MKDDYEPKDTIPFELGRHFAHLGDTSGVVITDEELETALRRLQDAVANQVVPDVWGRLAAEGDAAMEVEPSALYVSPTPESTQGVIDSNRPVADHPKGKRGLGRSRRWGRVASGVAAAAVLFGLFATPVGGKVMAGAMKTLYFQNLMGVNEDDLTQIESALTNVSENGTAKHIDLHKYGSVQMSGGEYVQPNPTLAQAKKLAGIPIKMLPGFDAKKDNVDYVAARDVTFHFNVDAINDLLHRLGGKTEFPASVKGQPIVLHVPAQITEQVAEGGNYMNLSALQMPTVQVPSGVDLNQVRQALIDLPFLPTDLQQSLSEMQNWKDTLYVPVDGKVTNLTLNGYPAVLQYEGTGVQPTIIWLEHGILYRLQGSPQMFPTAQSIVEQAKELTE